MKVSQLNINTAKSYLKSFTEGTLKGEKRASQDFGIEDTMTAINDTESKRYKLVLMDRNLAGIPDGNPDPGVVDIEFNGSRAGGEYNGNGTVGDFVVEENGSFMAATMTEDKVQAVGVTESDEGFQIEAISLNRYGTGSGEIYFIAK